MLKVLKEKEEVKKTVLQEAGQDEQVETKKESFMESVLATSPNPPSVDDVIEGKVIGIEKARVYVDIPPFGTGIIFGREYINARDIIKKINVGDSVAGKVVSLSNKDGYIEISLKEARQALIWNEAEDAIRDKKIFELTVSEANKGGLILTWQGISGFLPASQLKTEHYPRVSDGDKDRILEELKKLVGPNFRGNNRCFSKGRQAHLLREKPRAEKQRLHYRQIRSRGGGDRRSDGHG